MIQPATAATQRNEPQELLKSEPSNSWQNWNKSSQLGKLIIQGRLCSKSITDHSHVQMGQINYCKVIILMEMGIVLIRVCVFGTLAKNFRCVPTLLQDTMIISVLQGDWMFRHWCKTRIEHSEILRCSSGRSWTHVATKGKEIELTIMITGMDETWSCFKIPAMNC